ncbi:hypothetical protein Q5P01_005862 [Channa striata]|uniref:S100/CaBP-9k-type calcium binding subdomain domain-containing protein n=1 Tax=Channa striata TaxID=64152 RepID=A0AA88T7R4_CHASR|nr:hypothetical protein Q5P01_005862 [Channa striata]
MATIIAVFQKYSEREGDKHKLKKSELKELLQDELPDLMTHVKDQAALDSLMESLDTDGDAECDFQEFMTFIAMVTICCHEFFEHEDDCLQILRPAAPKLTTHCTILLFRRLQSPQVNINMSLSMTTAFRGLSHRANSDLVTRIGEAASDHGDLAALIGGIVSAVLLVLICVIALMLWCLSRHKGSYVTNEDDDEDDGENNDDESVRSDAALQAKEPLKLKDEE